MLEGEPNIEFDDGEILKPGKMDPIFIDANEKREIRNETNAVATMLVVMLYTPDN